MHHTRSKALLGAVGALLAVAGALLLVLGLVSPQATPTPAADLPRPPDAAVTAPARASKKPANSPAKPATSPAKPAPSTAKPAKSRPALVESTPTRVRIDAVDVDAPTVKLGLADDATMETPADPDDVGWFGGAHTPGGPGVAVLAGHVTWNGRKTVFFDLGRLERGTEIAVDRKNGTTATYAVTRRSTFAKDAFPTREVYKGGFTPELVLITCGGTYDRNQRSYDANVIVWAELTGVRAT